MVGVGRRDEGRPVGEEEAGEGGDEDHGEDEAALGRSHRADCTEGRLRPPTSLSVSTEKLAKPENSNRNDVSSRKSTAVFPLSWSSTTHGSQTPCGSAGARYEIVASFTFAARPPADLDGRDETGLDRDDLEVRGVDEDPAGEGVQRPVAERGGRKARLRARTRGRRGAAPPPRPPRRAVVEAGDQVGEAPRPDEGVLLLAGDGGRPRGRLLRRAASTCRRCCFASSSACSRFSASVGRPPVDLDQLAGRRLRLLPREVVEEAAAGLLPPSRPCRSRPDLELVERGGGEGAVGPPLREGHLPDQLLGRRTGGPRPAPRIGGLRAGGRPDEEQERGNARRRDFTRRRRTARRYDAPMSNAPKSAARSRHGTPPRRRHARPASRRRPLRRRQKAAIAEARDGRHLPPRREGDPLQGRPEEGLRPRRAGEGRGGVPGRPLAHRGRPRSGDRSNPPRGEVTESRA